MYCSSNWFINRLSEDDFGMISARLYVYIKFLTYKKKCIYKVLSAYSAANSYLLLISNFSCLPLIAGRARILLHWQRHIWLSQAKVPAVDWGAHS